MTEAGRARAARFTPSLVRLLRPDGGVVGLGLLVGRDQIVTCAHVVNHALDREITTPEPPERPVQLDFPFTAPGHRFTAAIEAWVPLAGDGGGDIAGLRLYGEPPEGAVPSPMAAADDVFGHPFQVFGFPAGHDTGVWVTGEFRGSDTVGSIHLVGETESGLRISPGFSGSPVWDAHLDAVVGITSRAALNPSTPPSAYCLTTRSIVEAWPDVEPAMRPPCPFRGLQAFREVDEDDFFGRERLTELLVEELPRQRLTIITGPSGCGKSSAINAGVIPGLRRRPDLAIAVCRPGVAPYAALAEAVAPGTAADPAEPTDGDTLVRWAADRLDADERERLVLFVDQVEELFAHPPDVVAGFADSLLRLASARRPDGRPLVCVVLATRGDHLDRLTGLTPVAEALALGRDDPQSGIRNVLPMTGPELREAVERPVGRARVVRLEDGLTDRLLRDVRGLVNPLALLAFTMTELWDRQRLGVITFAAYEEIGGVAGALRRHLDRVIDEELSADERLAARRILVRLAIPRQPEGYAGRQLRREELDPEHWPLVQRLAGRRVVTLDVAADGAETVELAHEALLEEWPALREWLDTDREFLTWYSDLRMAMAVWDENRGSSEGLLQSTRLADAERWVETRGADLTGAETAFVARSRRAVAFRRRVRTIIALSMVLVLTLSAGFALLWTHSEHKAQSASDEMAASVNAALASRSGDPVTALPAVLARYQRSTPVQALRAMQDWYGKTEAVRWLTKVDFTAPALSPDGVHAVANDQTGQGIGLVRLDDPALPTVPVTEGRATARTFSPDGRYVVYADSRSRIVFWDVERRSVVRRVPTDGPKDAVVRTLAVAPSGDRLAYARGDTVRIVDAHDGKPVDPGFAMPQGESRLSGRLWFDRSGGMVYAFTGKDDEVYELASGRLRPLADPPLVHSADGAAYVTCRTEQKSGRGSVAVRDARTGTRIGPQLDLGERCLDDTFGLDARHLYVAHNAKDNVPDAAANTTLEVRDVDSGAVTARLRTPLALELVATSGGSDGTRLLVRAIDAFYGLRVPPADSLEGSLGLADDAVLTPDGTRAATVSAAGLRVWDVPGRRLVGAVPGKTLCAGAVPKEPRSLLVTGGSGDDVAVTCRHVITVVDVRSGQVTRTLSLGPAEGPPKDQPGSFPDPPRVIFTGPHELLVNFGRLTLFDTSTGRLTHDVVPGFLTAYSAIAPGYGSPDIAVLRRDRSVVDILDTHTGHRVQSLPVHLRNTDQNAVTLAFDQPAGLLAVTTTDPPSAAVWSLSQRERRATLPATTNVEPVGFTHGDDLLVLRSLGDLFGDGTVIYWHWRGRLSRLSGGDTTRLPAATMRMSLAADARRMVYSESEGWELLDLDPDAWRRRLCGLATESRIRLTPPRTASPAAPCPAR